MLTVETLIAVLGFALACASVGYAVGYHHGRSQK